MGFMQFTDGASSPWRGTTDMERGEDMYDSLVNGIAVGDRAVILHENRDSGGVLRRLEVMQISAAGWVDLFTGHNGDGDRTELRHVCLPPHTMQQAILAYQDYEHAELLKQRENLTVSRTPGLQVFCESPGCERLSVWQVTDRSKKRNGKFYCDTHVPAWTLKTAV